MNLSGCLQSLLVPEANEFSQWEAEGEMCERPITAVIPVWRSLTTLDMSHNSISAIDRSVVRTLLLPVAPFRLLSSLSPAFLSCRS